MSYYVKLAIICDRVRIGSNCPGLSRTVPDLLTSSLVPEGFTIVGPGCGPDSLAIIIGNITRCIVMGEREARGALRVARLLLLNALLTVEFVGVVNSILGVACG